MPSSKSYPSPLVIPPLGNDQHTHTIILLHGRSSNSERFGHVFIESTGIAKRLPTTKFIFPTARKRRSTVLKRTPINQWFDNYSLEDPNIRTELQLDGLEESSEFLRGLIDEERGLLSNDSAVSDSMLPQHPGVPSLQPNGMHLSSSKTPEPRFIPIQLKLSNNLHSIRSHCQATETECGITSEHYHRPPVNSQNPTRPSPPTSPLNQPSPCQCTYHTSSALLQNPAAVA